MEISVPVKKLLRCIAALLIVAVAVLPALAASVWFSDSQAAPTTGRRGFDQLNSGALYASETTVSLEEMKTQGREEDCEEYIPHVWPVRFSDHGYISSHFGSRIDPVTGEGTEFHGGVDLADKPGTKIHASASGIVVEAYESSGYGLNIVIDHGNGYQTRYSHCNSLLVSEGDRVNQGQVIATMGDTGRVTGVHLDFRVYLDGVAIDPLKVLDGQ